MLIVLGGPPGAGKTTIAQALARRIRAAHLRLDRIEAALGTGGGAIVEDMLGSGQTVIADTINPTRATRAVWRAAAAAAGVTAIEVEIVRDGQAAPPGYEPWDTDRVVVDTTDRTVDQGVTEILAAFQKY